MNTIPLKVFISTFVFGLMSKLN